MDVIPEEVTENELLPLLDPKSLSQYCIISRKYPKLCRSSAFWNDKVKSTPRRELQNEWFLGLAHQRETILLSYLLAAIDKNGVIIDNQAICHAAFLLLEEEEDLSSDGKVLVATLTERAESDKELTILGITSLREFHAAIMADVEEFKKILELNPKRTVASPTSSYYDAGRNRVDYFLQKYRYTQDYVYDYLYSQTKYLLAPLSEYAAPITSAIPYPVRLANFALVLTKELLKAEKVNEVKQFLISIIKNTTINPSLPTFYQHQIFAAVLEYGTYEQAQSIVDIDNVKNWKEAGRYVSRVQDVNIYFQLVLLADYNWRRLAAAYECFEPEEFIDYVDSLVAKKRISNNDRQSALEEIMERAFGAGYTYMATIIKIELKQDNLDILST